jgi:hypothetical protein
MSCSAGGKNEELNEKHFSRAMEVTLRAHMRIDGIGGTLCSTHPQRQDRTPGRSLVRCASDVRCHKIPLKCQADLPSSLALPEFFAHLEISTRNIIQGSKIPDADT